MSIIMAVFAVYLHDFRIINTSRRIKNRGECMREIRRLLNNGKYEEIVRMLEGKKLDADEYVALGVAYYMMGKRNKAISNLKRAISMNPDHEDALFNLAEIYLNLEKYIKAKEYALRLLKISESWEVHDILASCYEFEGFYDRALSHLSKAIELAPSDALRLLKERLDILKNKVRKAREHEKLAIISAKGLDNFIDDIVKGLRDEYWVQRWAVNNSEDVKMAIDWADIVWLEWANEVAIFGSNYSGILDKRVVLRLHGYESLRKDFLNKINWEVVDHVIFVAKNVMNTAISNQPKISKIPHSFIPNGIDLKKYRFKDRKEGFKVAFLGHMNYKKNPMMTVQILKKLVDLDKRYVFYWGGDIQDERIWRYLNYILDDMNLKEHFIFDGWIEDTDEWLEDKDIFLSTSIHEGYGVAIMEAMAKGLKPVIHNFYIAREFYPREYIFNTVDEAVKKIVDEPFKSREYRGFIEKYSLEKQLHSIKQVIKSLGKGKEVIWKTIEDNVKLIDWKSLPIVEVTEKNFEDYIERVLRKINAPISVLKVDDIYIDRNVEYMIDFLEKVVKEGKPYQNTKYYWFLKDAYKRGHYSSFPEEIVFRFLKLYDEILRDGFIRKPIVTFYNPTGKAEFNVIKDTGVELKTMDTPKKFIVVSGRHRLSIAKFLGNKTINSYVLENRFKDHNGIKVITLPFWRDFISAHDKEYEEKSNITYAGKFDGNYHQNKLNPIKKKLIYEYILSKKPKLVVDVGCNRGELSYGLKEYGIRVIGIDVASREELGLPEDYEFIQMDIVKEELPIENADIILFLSVYHHLVYSYGLEKADETFWKLYRKTRYLIFDTGSPHESGMWRQGWVRALRKHFGSEREIFEHFGVPYKIIGKWETGYGERTIVSFLNE